jgi:hypothetical protein
MKIAFHDNSLSLRGTTVALYDYAYFTRKYLGNESIILYNKNHSANSDDVVKKFKKEFDVFEYDSLSQIDEILSRERCDYFFMEKGGKPDGIISSICTNLVHAIGICNKNDTHGDKFAMGSEWLSKITNYEIPYVPYIVHLPEHNQDMRENLGIPEEHFVFGRNGGWETFDIDWAKSAVIESLNLRNDIWFIFQFTQPFIQHERVIYLPGNSDLNDKVKFINTCDVMIHARQVGESFGLSCAEFSIRNKPVITWHGSPERNHIDILDKNGFYYNNKKELLDMILNISKFDIENKDWNCYKEYTPEKIIKKFEEVYLK